MRLSGQFGTNHDSGADKGRDFYVVLVNRGIAPIGGVVAGLADAFVGRIVSVVQLTVPNIRSTHSAAPSCLPGSIGIKGRTVECYDGTECLGLSFESVKCNASVSPTGSDCSKNDILTVYEIRLQIVCKVQSSLAEFVITGLELVKDLVSVLIKATDALSVTVQIENTKCGSGDLNLICFACRKALAEESKAVSGLNWLRLRGQIKLFPRITDLGQLVDAGITERYPFSVTGIHEFLHSTPP